MNSLNECLNWSGRLNTSGYGITRTILGENRLHRILWAYATQKPIPKGMCVLHKCDNPACFRLEHLFLGTHAENMQDKYLKGRAKGKSFPGEANHFHKLKTAQVVAIRQRHAQGQKISAIAKDYLVSYRAIYNIVNRSRWRSVA